MDGEGQADDADRAGTVGDDDAVARRAGPFCGAVPYDGALRSSAQGIRHRARAVAWQPFLPRSCGSGHLLYGADAGRAGRHLASGARAGAAQHADRTGAGRGAARRARTDGMEIFADIGSQRVVCR